jgi:PAS domain-containing protein
VVSCLAFNCFEKNSSFAMGHAASFEIGAVECFSPKRAFDSTVLCGTTVREAFDLYMNNADEQISFVKFIKEGVWLDDIGLDHNFKDSDNQKGIGNISPTKSKLSDQAGILFDYIVPLHSYHSMRHSILSLIEEGENEDEDTKGKKLTEQFQQSCSSLQTDSNKTAFDSTKSCSSDTIPAQQGRYSISISNLQCASSIGIGIGNGNGNSNSNSIGSCSRSNDENALTTRWPAGGGSGSQTSNRRDFHDDYFDLDNSTTTTGFTRIQMLSILFQVVHPLFVKSKQATSSAAAAAQSVSQLSTTHSVSAVGSSATTTGPATCSGTDRSSSRSSTPEACRAEELLLSAAAYFDADRMVRALASPCVLAHMMRAFQQCSLGIAVCDVVPPAPSSPLAPASAPAPAPAPAVAALNLVDCGLPAKLTYPIQYANSGLEALTGYSGRQLRGKTFKVLQGPATEPEQIKRIAAALEAQQPIKLALTNYRRNKTPFLNMLILKPVFDSTGTMRHVISVSYDVSRSNITLQDIQHADVVLALLPLILAANLS